MTKIVFAAGALARLRETLLASAPYESAAVLLAAEAGEDVLLVNELHLPPPEFVDRHLDRVTIAPAFFMPLVKQARIHGWSVVFVHTHPWAATPVFSPIDDETEEKLFATVCARAPARRHASIVLGSERAVGRTWTVRGREAVDEVRDVGAVVGVDARDAAAAPLHAALDRNVRAFGAEGQRKLRNLRVAIVGAGGIGSHVAQQLGHLAIGSLILVDDDALEVTNLNRVIGSHAAAVGKPKVDVLAGAVASINPAVTVTAIARSILQIEVARRLRDVDAIFCCTDTHGSRAVLNQLAYQYYVPLFDAGVRIDAEGGIVTRIGGRAQLLAPGLGCLSCSGLLDFAQVRRDLQSDDERARDPYIVGHREPQPSVVSLNGVVASLAVTMFLATFVGFAGTARYQVYRAESGTVRAVVAPRDPACIVCAPSGVLGRGDLVSLIGRTG